MADERAFMRSFVLKQIARLKAPQGTKRKYRTKPSKIWVDKMKSLFFGHFSRVAAAGLFLGAFSCASIAADASGPYVFGAVGASYSDNDYSDRVGPLNDTYNDDTRNHESLWNAAGKLGAGWRVNDWFGVEGAFYWLGETAHEHSGNAKTGGAHHKSRAEFKGWAFGVDAVGFWPVADDVTLFAKAGAALVRVEGENRADQAEFDFSVSDTRLAPKLSAGLEWNLTDAMALRVEYEHFFNAAKSETKAGTVRMPDLDYDLVTVGVRWAL